MPPLDFVHEYSRIMNGDGDPFDPFGDMSGMLDDWWEDNFKAPTFTPQRESFSVEQYQVEPERVRSWDKQAQDILGVERGQAGEGQGQELRAPFNVGEFSLNRWQTQYENAKIPAKAMAKVPGTGFLMEPHAAQALNAMFRAAQQDGIQLTIGNTYRDYDTQAGLYKAHVEGSHPAPVASPGSSNHGWGLAVDVASVGDREFQWLLNNAGRFGYTNPWVEGKGDRDSVEPWHWEYGGGGDTGSPPTEHRKNPDRQSQGQAEYVPFLNIDDLVSDAPAFGTVLASLLQPRALKEAGGPEQTSSTGAKGGSVKAQLARGFRDSGRPDLAKMVRTQDFQTWIDAESGWNVSSVSQYFPGHGRNFGLFQFWQGHAWTSNYLSGDQWTADPYTQAKLVSRYFPHLGPNDIRNYAQQIRAGDYAGWG